MQVGSGRRRWRRVLALQAIGALAVAGCSDDDTAAAGDKSPEEIRAAQLRLAVEQAQEDLRQQTLDPDVELIEGLLVALCAEAGDAQGEDPRRLAEQIEAPNAHLYASAMGILRHRATDACPEHAEALGPILDEIYGSVGARYDVGVDPSSPSTTSLLLPE